MEHKPRITSQPQDQKDVVGTATFTVQATGNGLVYRWEHEEGNDWKPLCKSDRIKGSNAATLTIAPLKETDEGRYWCIVRNHAGNISSKPADLTLAKPPQIITEPQDQTDGVGTETSFTVQATGTDPLTYCWEREKGGVWVPLPKLDHVSGRDSDTLTIDQLKEADEGRYRCTVTNLAGRISSEPAYLTVEHKPQIKSHPQDQKDAVGTATFTVQATGNDLVYRWEHEEGNDWKSLPKSDRIKGSTTDTLTIAPLKEADEGRYWCIVRNHAGNISSKPADLTVAKPPQIITEPQDQTDGVGSETSFTVQATGTDLLTYCWEREKGGVWVPLSKLDHVSGRDSDTLTIDQLKEADEGRYRCTVSNLAGRVSSEPAYLTVEHKPRIRSQPQDQKDAVGTATFTVQATGNGLVYRWEHEEDNDWKPLPKSDHIKGSTTATLTIAPLKEADEGRYWCIVRNHAGNISSEPADLTLAKPPQIITEPQDQTDGVDSETSFTVQATGNDLVYHWECEKDGVWGSPPKLDRIKGRKTATLTIDKLMEADEGRYRCTVSNLVGRISSEPAYLTVEHKPRITSQPQDQKDVVGTVTFTVQATGNGLVYRWEHEEGNDWKPLPESDRIKGSNTATLTIAPLKEADEGQYWCIVRNHAGYISSEPANLTVAKPPQITNQHPHNRIRRKTGDVVKFSVEAVGTSPLTYRWEHTSRLSDRDNKWQPVTDEMADNYKGDEGRQPLTADTVHKAKGTTTDMLTISELEKTDRGMYRCIVSNLAGEVTSNPIHLTVSCCCYCCCCCTCL